MGGSGSTRWRLHSKKYTVERSCVFDIKTIRSALVPSGAGTQIWNLKGQGVVIVRFRAIADSGHLRGIYLSYGSNTEVFNYMVGLVSTQLPWGGERYWFTCPNPACGRRVTKLYLPPSSPYFACRTCHQLTYKSCQEKGQFNASQHMAALMQDSYPGITAKDVTAIFEGRTTDNLMRIYAQQIHLENSLLRLAGLPDPHAQYLTADELCNQSGLSSTSLKQLQLSRLLVPNQDENFRPRLSRWATKLAYLLNQGWTVEEMKRWAKGRFKSGNPRQWPPERSDWQP